MKTKVEYRTEALLLAKEYKSSEENEKVCIGEIYVVKPGEVNINNSFFNKSMI